ncbi:MAG TPA: oxidoreductase [Bacteroidetes bacterium]|nr:oxidoreductase [Bacteroidota bacterium]
MSLSFHSIQVREIIRETPDAATIVFEIPEPLKTTFSYLPGQYVTVSTWLNGKEQRRAYSFCSSPYTDPHPAITVKKVSDGQVSPFLNDTLKAGDTIALMPPMGNFTAEIDPENRKNYVLFGGGSGITPIMSLLKSILKQEPLSTISLVYANRDEQSIIFHKELANLASAHPERLNIVHCLENAPAGFSGFVGRPTIADYQSITKNLQKEGRVNEYFICGPGGMMDAVKMALEGMGTAQELIHTEYFNTPVVSKETAASAPAHEEPFDGTAAATILFNGKQFEITIPEGVTVLEAAKDQNVDPPYACQMGVCTTCRAKIIEGSVFMDEREGLSDSEINEGYVLTCQSHPTSAKLKLIYE